MKNKEFKQSREEIEKILLDENLGYLGLSLDNEPYVVPLNYIYNDGKILFHCALEGRKLDFIRGNDNVCFTVARQSGTIQQHGKTDPCHMDSESVTCFGKACIIEDLDQRQQVLNTFNKRFDPEAVEITMERTKTCSAVEISIEEMIARQEKNREVTYWRYNFNE